MALTRGSVVFVRDKSDFLSKGRPAGVVQSADLIEARDSLTVVPFTSAQGAPLDRARAYALRAATGCRRIPMPWSTRS